MLDWIAAHPLYPLLALGTGFSAVWVVKRRALLRINVLTAIVLAILHTIMGIVSVKVFAFLEGDGPGAMSLFGAVFFLPLLYLLGAKLFKRSAANIADTLTPEMILTVMCARINCILSGCCQGRVMTFVTSHTVRWPTREAEVLFYIILLIVLVPKAWKTGKKIQANESNSSTSFWAKDEADRKLGKERFAEIPGTIYPFYMACYGAFRFVIEFFRESGAPGIFHIAHLWAALAFCIGGAVYWEIRAKAKKKKQ